MTRRQRLFVFAIAGFFALASVATFGFLIWKQFSAMVDPTPVSAADRRLVVTAADLLPFGAPAVVPLAENVTALRQIDGSFHVQYEYKPAKIDPANRIYMQSMAYVMPSGLTARQTFQMQKIALTAGLKVGAGKVTVTEAPQLVRGGDEHYAAILSRDGELLGNVFVVRQGKTVFSLILTGFVFEEPAHGQELLAPVLAEAARRAR